VRQFVIIFAVTMVIVVAGGGLASNAEAATTGGAGGLSSLANGYSPVQTVRCVCGPRGRLRTASWSSLGLLVA
jgi:hypothetical protein